VYLDVTNWSVNSDIIATGVQVAYTSAFLSANPTHDLWKWTLTTRVVECITIITSCIPYLRPLLEAIPSGLYGADEIRRRGEPSELGYSRRKSESYKLSSHSRGSDPKRRKSSEAEGLDNRRFMPMLLGEPISHSNSASGLPGGPRRPDGESGVDISAKRSFFDTGDDKGRWETESTSSQAKIIKTTVVEAAWEEAVTAQRSRETSGDEIEIEISRA
jgi:hypothetical protein